MKNIKILMGVVLELVFYSKKKKRERGNLVG